MDLVQFQVFENCVIFFSPFIDHIKPWVAFIGLKLFRIGSVVVKTSEVTSFRHEEDN